MKITRNIPEEARKVALVNGPVGLFETATPVAILPGWLKYR